MPPPGPGSRSWWSSSRADPGWPTPSGTPSPSITTERCLAAAGAESDGAGDVGSSDPVPAGTVRARVITPDDALLEYLAEHGLRRVSKRLMASGIVDLVAGAIPGIRDILVLGKVKQIERSRHGRPGPGRRPGHRPHHDVPLVGHRPPRRRPQWPDPNPGRRRGRPPVRSGAVPGGAGHPARGDAGQRGRSRPPTSSRTRSGSPSAR